MTPPDNPAARRPSGVRPVPTIADVAAMAKVSRGIASRILNEDPALAVRESTRARVIEVARSLQYTPNRAARSLRGASTGAIGLIEHDVSNPLHAETVRGAQKRAYREGYVMLLADAEELAHNDVAYRELLSSRRIDGVILHLGGWATDSTLRRLAENSLPTVLINSQMRAAAGSVVLEDEAAGILATKHLIELGHRRIGFFGALVRSPQSQRRLRGVQRTLHGAGLELEKRWILEAGFDQAGGQNAINKLLEQPDLPSAIVVANVMAAIGVLAAAREADLRIPEEMSVAAIHETWVAEHTEPPLTTVKLPLFELGEVAVGLVLNLIAGERRQHIRLDNPPPVLVRRQSTAAPGAKLHSVSV